MTNTSNLGTARLARARAAFNAIDNVIIALGNEGTPDLVHAAHIEADAELNAALNEMDAMDDAAKAA